MHPHKQHLTQAERVRELVLDEAVQAGKFPASRKDHYRRLYASDPHGTADLIGRLAPGLPPADATPAPVALPAAGGGHYTPPVGAALPAAGGGHYTPPVAAPPVVPGDDDYPQEWLAPEDLAASPRRGVNVTMEL